VEFGYPVFTSGVGMASRAGALGSTSFGFDVFDAAEVRAGVQRLMSVDLLRGLVMVVMALDHVRDFMTWRAAPPEFLETHNSLAIFLTRWVTHFCAPTFFFLAGTGAYLMLARRSASEVSRFLWTRGLWLIVLECTIVWFAWTFIPVPIPNIIVIFALGVCMIILAGLVYIPIRWLAPLSLVMIAGHNLFDGIRANTLSTPWREVWMVLHDPGLLKPPPHPFFFVMYPVLPWFAVMSAGFCFGVVITSRQRVKYTAWIGASTTAAFIVLRSSNLYGNGTNPDMFATGPWHHMQSTAMTVASFLNTTKYPPSLDYLLMTIGPALLFLALATRLDWGRGKFSSKLAVFGRVPMFYYICHLFVTHLVALALATAFHEPAKHLGWMGGGFFIGHPSPGFGFNLPMIYFAWILSIVLLYFPCAWYANYKAEHKQNKWLSYM